MNQDIYMYMYIYVYVYIYTYIYIHTYILRNAVPFIRLLVSCRACSGASLSSREL